MNKWKKSVKKFFWRVDFTPFMSKSFSIWDHFFSLLLPKDIGLWEVGTERLLNGVRKCDGQKDRQTNRHTYTHLTYRNNLPRGPILWKSHIQETNNLLTNADSSTNTEKNLLVRQNLPKFFCVRQFYNLYKQKFSNLRPLIFYHFCPRIPKLLKFWTLDFGKWGQKDV